MAISRLSDLNIEDDILRAIYYRRVLSYVATIGADLFPYTIKIDEEYRADLVAYRSYGNSELRWVITLLTDIDDEANSLPVGDEIFLPTASWLRRDMRQFMDEMGL